MCKSICELILAIILIVVSLWQLAASAWSGIAMWIVLIVGIILLVHSFTCKKCFAGSMEMKGKRN